MSYDCVVTISKPAPAASPTGGGQSVDPADFTPVYTNVIFRKHQHKKRPFAIGSDNLETTQSPARETVKRQLFITDTPFTLDIRAGYTFTITSDSNAMSEVGKIYTVYNVRSYDDTVQIDTELVS